MRIRRNEKQTIERRPFTSRMNPDLLARAKVLAAQRRVSLQRVFEEAVSSYLESGGRKRGVRS